MGNGEGRRYLHDIEVVLASGIVERDIAAAVHCVRIMFLLNQKLIDLSQIVGTRGT